jgi:glucose/arabinose dehydrogenase
MQQLCALMLSAVLVLLPVAATSCPASGITACLCARHELLPGLAAAEPASADVGVQTPSDPTEFAGQKNRNRVNRFEKYGQWRLLFDGQTTSGWRNYRKDTISEGWQVIEGALVRAAQGAGDIVTTESFENFELQLEYKISTGGNSGIMFHVTEDQALPWHSGPEIQINDHAHGRDPQKAGWLYQLYQPVKPKWMQVAESEVGIDLPRETDAARPAGQWNHVYLLVTAGQCQVLVNGVMYYQFQLGSDDWNQRVAQSKFARFESFGKARKGHLCLQDHGNLVAFRNIKVRELDASGLPPEPIDGTLPVAVRPAFGEITWQDWESVNDEGKVQELRPVAMTHAADGSGRLFVATQDGMIQSIRPQQDPQQARMFLDLREAVRDFKEGHNEEGLLGLAFDPQFESSGEFYVYYTTDRENLMSLVSRFRVSRDDPDRADPASEQIVMKIAQPFHNHNGGAIEFGPDGYLYIGLGDGGSGNDPYGNGQDLTSWMGKILRIDVRQRSGDRQYSIPADNPFVATERAAPEIYAYGFRNPWRITFDRETGQLWEGEVGQDYWEEVNVVEKGGNYGWSAVEGTFPFSNRRYSTPSRPVRPVWEYDHLVGKSITGGYVYRGPGVPALQGAYLYADYVTGKIWGLKLDADGKLLWNKSIPTEKMPVLAFGEGEDGEIYYSIPTSTGQGIYRFVQSQ